MIIERLGQYIKKKDISFYLFENSIGASRGSISKAIKNKTSIGSNVLENILNVYTDLNPVWLLTGREDMLITGNSDVKNEEDNLVNNTSLNDFDKRVIINYVSDNLSEFQSYNSFQKLTNILFADDEIGKVKSEVEALKKQVAKLVKDSSN